MTTSQAFSQRLRDAASCALATHNVLQDVSSKEPKLDPDGSPIDPDQWLQWHESYYRPAYETWSRAMDDLSDAGGHPISRHPMNFRPFCEELLGRVSA